MSGNHMKVTLIISEMQMVHFVNVSLFTRKDLLFSFSTFTFPSATLLSPIKTKQNAVPEQKPD